MPTPMYDESVAYSTVTLKRLSFMFGRAIRARSAGTFAIPPEIELGKVAFHGVVEEVILRVRQDVLSQHLERTHVRYPLTWRDAVKVAFYKWLSVHWPWGRELAAKKWPVVFKVIEIKPEVLYPQIALPEHHHVLTFLREERQEVENW
jgi:hypothetical protein